MFDGNHREQLLPYDDRPEGIWRYLVAFLVVAAAAGLIGYLYFGKDRLMSLLETREAVQSKQLAVLYRKWDVEPLPKQVLADARISQKLQTLSREPCDWRVLLRLTDDLRRADFRRQAAGILLGYSHNCLPSNVALYTASDILYGLGDLDAALKISDELIEMSGDISQFHFARAQMLEAAGKHQEAIDAFYSSIGLASDPATLTSLPFTGIASNEAALGNYCAAIEPLQSWLSIDPANRDTPRLRTLMQNYALKGNCEKAHASGKDRFPVSGNDVIIADIVVNGASGRFIVDTGASFVAVTPAFARKAELATRDDYPVSLQTANGIAKAQRVSVPAIRLGKVTAKDVAAVVLEGGKASLGNDIDGLLGRSFLSRFNVTFDAREWRVSAK